MTTDEPRVWLLPNGKVALKRNSDWMEVDRWGSFYDGESHATHIEFLDELPDAAVPLVALPASADVDWDDHECIVRHREPTADFPSDLVHKDTTVERFREHIEWLATNLADHIAALELLELEGGSSAAEAARRKVLADLKPGVYALQVSHIRTRAVIVTVDGRLMLATPTGVLEDWTDRYGDPHFLGSAPQLTLLAEGDLSPVVGE